MADVSKTEQFKYPECGKGGDHIGEVLNIVCIEPKCIENSIICGICYDESHKNHKIKPLKMVINQSKKYLQQLTPMNIDSSKIKISIEQTKARLIQKFSKFETELHQSIANIKNNINAVFIKITDQIELKTGGNDELLKALEQIKVKEMEYDRFVYLMKKLLAGVPLNEKQQENEVTSLDIEKSVVIIEKKLETDMEKKSKKVSELLNGYLTNLQKLADSPSIFDGKATFKFSTELKHNGANVVSDKIIKSTEAYNYHLGLMEPSLQDSGKKGCTVGFKINQNTSSWLAVGVCYKNIAQSNNYQFNYSSLGHGGYMVSCNAGSWSSTDSTKNNVVTAFNYYKGDIILVTYDPDESKVLFKKKGTEESYTLEFEPVEGDELHFCALFYYNNDEIEYLGHADEIQE